MKITNFNLSGNNTRITWEANGKPCEFINPIPLKYGVAVNFVDELTEDEMQEFYITPQPSNYIELLGMVVANGRKINMVS